MREFAACRHPDARLHQGDAMRATRLKKIIVSVMAVTD
jgi:hypothetical protein